MKNLSHHPYPDFADTVILGAGIAGLSAANHLQSRQQDYLLIEKESRAGGIARTRTVDGFHFDCGGHYLHLREAWTREWVRGLLGDNCLTHRRRAFIHLEDRQIPYPFQAHLSHLSPRMAKECLQGFQSRPKANPGQIFLFKDWVRSVFGSGISKHFMEPYNKKLMQSHYARLTTDWTLNHIPKISLRDLKNPERHSWGYNVEFYYPRQGGIGAFSDILSNSLQRLHLNTPFKHIEPGRVILQNGKSVHFKKLISSIPLPALIQSLSFAPLRIRRLASRLKSVGILCLNLGVSENRFGPRDWIYYPEKKYPFYRIGSYSSVASSMAPSNGTSLYVELPGTRDIFRKTDKELLRFLFPFLKEQGILRKQSDVQALLVDRIQTAYVVYDAYRKQAVPHLLSWLQTQNIHSIGRFGKWQYSSMEQALIEGRDAVLFDL